MSRKNRIITKQRQHQTNQQNAQHSTGPVTTEGKAASSQNSFRHGLTACSMTMLAGEDPQNYMDLGNSLRAEHKPATPTEDALVTKLIESLWLSARAVKLQQALFLEPQYRRIDLDLYMRYQKMHDRAFSKALDDLIKLRKEARQQQIGSVSQQQEAEIHTAKIRNLNVRSESQEATTQLQKIKIAATSTAAPPKRPLTLSAFIPLIGGHHLPPTSP